MLQCVQNGHEIVALANLRPSVESMQSRRDLLVVLLQRHRGPKQPRLKCISSGGKDELDSFMFQTVGHEAIEMIAEAMQLVW